MTDTIGTSKVTLIRENEDGSADYQFNFSLEELDALTRLGILTAIKAGIEDAKKLDPETYKDWHSKFDPEEKEALVDATHLTDEEFAALAYAFGIKEKNT